MINKNVTSTKTKLTAIRVPHEILKLIKGENNKSAALIDLLKIGAEKKYNANFK